MSNIEYLMGKLFDFSEYRGELTPSLAIKVSIVWGIFVIVGFAMSLFLVRLSVFKLPQDINQARKIVIGAIIDVLAFLILTIFITISTRQVGIFNFIPYVITIFPYLCFSLLTKGWSGCKTNKTRLMSSFLEYILLVILYWLTNVTLLGVAKFSSSLPNLF